MNLREARCKFSELLADLLLWARFKEYDFALDEGMQHQQMGHMKGSLHYSGCAQDILLYDKNGEYLRDQESYREMGEHWETLHPYCRWGGRFQDGNHFSFAVPELFGTKV